MKGLLLASAALLIICCAIGQNVFNPDDPTVRWNSTQPLGSSQNPNPATVGLQKWVSVATNGISTGSNSFDATSFKAYYINTNGIRMAFRLKYPRSYKNPDSAGKKYPVMLFFHGAGEPGCSSNGGIYNNEKQLIHGGRLFRDRVDNNSFDGFLVYPQIVVTSGCWSVWGTSYFTPIQRLLDSLGKYTRLDVDRVMAFGLSDGGAASWRFASMFPTRVTKIAPSSASFGATLMAPMVHIPVWLATGAKDTNPSPAQANSTASGFRNLGGDIIQTLYADLGHGVWNRHWGEEAFVPYMNNMHKANPLVFYQRYDFCPDSPVNVKLGITAGFYAYEWERDGSLIATRTNGVNTIVNPAHIISYTGNEITVKSFGTYRARFKRIATGAWSDWSPMPAIIKPKTVTQTPPIQIVGASSKVLPALDGKTTVALQLPAGFLNYQWYRVSDNVIVSTQQTYNAPVGEYKARYSEQFGCGTTFSPNFKVVNANGSPKPDPAMNLVIVALSQTVMQLNWDDNPSPSSNETGYEIYRSLKPNGPYQFIALTAENANSYQDENLNANTVYYYVVRAVNETGAAAKSNEAAAKTQMDFTAPTAPANLQYRGSDQRTVSLQWNASADNIGIKRYDIYVNGAKTFSTTKTSHTVTGLDSLTSYAFTVRAVDQVGNVSEPSNQVIGYTHQQGINYKYYHGTWSSLPNFNNISVEKSGITDTISITSGIRTRNDNFGFMWQGYIYTPVTATYTFETYSDDGSKLYIDRNYSSSAPSVVSNDGTHGARSRTGNISLTQGYHQIVVTYFDRSNGEEMQVYWSNDAGLARERIPKRFFSHVSAALPARPIEPGSLVATATSYNKIRLNWVDNSSNETGFEIIRSNSISGPYLPVSTTAANATTYTDSGLNELTTYYYRVRSVSTGGESSEIQALATTPASPMTPNPATNLSAHLISSNMVAISWNDNSDNEAGFQIWRSAVNQSSFQLIQTVDANNNAYGDVTVVPFTRYYYYVVAVNNLGAAAPSNTIDVTTGNNAPVIGTINPLYVKTDASAISNFTVTDAVGDVVSVSITSKPSFITVQNTGGTNYRITASPTVDNVGWFSFTLVATDDKGVSSSKVFSVSVADKNTRSVFVNFGNTTKAAPMPWNNWLGVRAVNSAISSLKDENNATTTFGITMLTGWSSLSDLGHITGNNSGVYPDPVLQGGIADAGTGKQIRINGLSVTKMYNLVFIASQNEGTDATSEYVVGTQRDTLNARYNTNQTANLNGLVPNSSGQIVVTINKLSPSLMTYLSGIVIEEYTPSTTLLNPLNLFVEPVDRTSVNLSWSDRTNDENATGGYELQRASDSLFTQNVTTISLQRNVTTYKNTGLAPNTKYWYRVRAKNGTSNFSLYSNRVSTITPASIVYVNFNYTVPSAGSPWNNTFATPTAVTTFSNLRNQSAINSGIEMTIEKIFNGEFNAGMNTGNNSGIVPDNVLMANYWLDKTQLSQIRVSGLNHTRRYRFGFFGSSSPNGWFKGNYTATYTINDRTVYLNSWENKTKIVYIGDVVPDENGEVMLNFSTTVAASYGFNGGVIIYEYVDQQGGTVKNMMRPSNEFEELVTERSPAVDQADISMLNARMYPNPFHDFIHIDFYNSSLSNRISAEIFDLNGKLRYRRFYNNVAAGSNSLHINTTEAKLRTGVYIVVLKANGKKLQSGKMMYIKN